MKKFVIIIMLAVISIGSYAQTEKGRSSVGFNIGYGFDDPGNATLGIDFRHCILDNFRIAPSLSYYVKNKGLSAWAIDVNAHYVVKLSEMFGFYPLAGLDMSFWNASAMGISANATRFGANIGLGGEVYATDNFNIGLEVKYQILKDFSRPMLGVRAAYNF